jgi:hypothetical protein
MVQQFFSCFMSRTSSFSMGRWWGPLSWIFIVLAYWNNSPRIDTSLHSDTLFWFRANQSLLLRTELRSNKNQFHSLWFDPTGTRTHYLPHSRWACLPLRHRYGSHSSWIYNYLSSRGVLDTTLGDKVYQWLATRLWFSRATLISTTNKSDRYDIT